MNQGKWLNPLLVIVIIGSFLVLVLSLWMGGGKAAEQAEGAIEPSVMDEAANATNFTSSLGNSSIHPSAPDNGTIHANISPSVSVPYGNESRVNANISRERPLI